jgi:hypothetical protein
MALGVTAIWLKPELGIAGMTSSCRCIIDVQQSALTISDNTHAELAAKTKSAPMERFFHSIQSNAVKQNV